MTRGRALGAVVVLAAATFGLASLPWFSATVVQVSGEETISIAGTGASPVIGALLLVVGAGVVAYLLARGVLARIVAGVLTVAGAAVVASCVVALQDPAAPCSGSPPRSPGCRSWPARSPWRPGAGCAPPSPSR
ncbi:Trp biosynthesis-associated membrane protein [Serinibacter arcticus]|uniref:Trp biosynthesis-associated membrane protein n=1 Tax=Serinibacter arcticus TaxID=1655435 RepID=UPI001304BCE0|nr:Trp biosynthesis-associated membrane protein [Serinibacter arcticus]